MIELLRNDYIKSKTQIIILNKDREIIESDNSLFDIALKTKIENFHPFFSIMKEMLLQPNTETVFNGVHIDYQNVKKTLEVIVNSGNESTNAFLIFIDFTNYYSGFQSLAQEKNESVLTFHLEELKTMQLKSEKNIKENFLNKISEDFKSPVAQITNNFSLLKQTNLNSKQLEILTRIEQSGDLVLQLLEELKK